MQKINPNPSSFRDPEGYVVSIAGSPARVITAAGKRSYDALMGSGLYDALAGRGLLVEHREMESIPDGMSQNQIYKVIVPKKLPFVSYPYEWCFSQLRDAAITTLEVQEMALKHGMTLKDASPFNVMFVGYKPLFIDTLSFEPYEEGAPWKPYRQFCETFLAPLFLMSKLDLRLGSALKHFLDGIPLDLCRKLLGKKAIMGLAPLTHIWVHSFMQKRYADTSSETGGYKKGISRKGIEALIDNLHGCINRLKPPRQKTPWREYYAHTSYSESSFLAKKEGVLKLAERIKPKMVWDIGGNTGEFSTLFSERKIYTVCFDGDIGCVEECYIGAKKRRDKSLLPLFLDITNPTPAVGWQNEERESILSRGPADLVLFLAVIHHIALGHNVPLSMIAKMLSQAAKNLAIEFVPKEDPQAQRLLINKGDIFPDYTEENFRREFSKAFRIEDRIPIEGSGRSLYLMSGA
ncbi:MAG: SAM-dependent methyltransferase [Candidatus Dadabacteria bacterium]|nr:MAG: SAM-dependent methyltransferase [Candidatus Dadabacteria bacterium]